MYITGIPTKTSKGKLSHTCILLRESYWDKKDQKVRNRTIANLTHCNPKEIEAMRFALKNKDDLKKCKNNLIQENSLDHQQGLSVGAVCTVYEIAKEVGLEKALGRNHQGRLALWQIIARVLEQGSRLSAVRLAQVHAAADVLGIRQGFNEDHLYRNLSWLAENQAEIEKKLFNHTHNGSSPELFLYDVTSSYLEGQCNEFGDFGYNRDRKKGKQQVVVGLLCDETGNPVSAEVFQGNTNDTETFASQIDKAAQTYGCNRVTFVGDRGMIKSTQVKKLKTVDYHHITAITKPQIQKLLRTGVFQMNLFTQDVCEIEHNEERYVLRRNPIRAKEMKQTRKEKERVIRELVENKNQYLTTHPRSKEETAIREVNQKILRLKANLWLSITSNGRKLVLIIDEKNLMEIAQLDGCYVLKTDLPKTISKEIIHQRYKDLTLVEEAFRTMKTVLLEMRPWYVRTKESTRGHALIAMLSFLIVRCLKKRWKALNYTVEEGLKHLALITSNEILHNGNVVCQKVALQNKLSEQLLDAAKLTLPQVLPKLGANIVSRKKLPNRRKRI